MMNEIILDTNIILNVWNGEHDPRTGKPLWESSAKLLELTRNGSLNGHICIVCVYELMHSARLYALNRAMDQDAAMRQALNRLSEYNLEQLIPRQFALTETTSYILKLHLDPYDAVMLSTAIDSDMDAIISRDAKLAAKAAEFVPVLSPEEFLAKVSG